MKVKLLGRTIFFPKWVKYIILAILVVLLLIVGLIASKRSEDHSLVELSNTDTFTNSPSSHVSSLETPSITESEPESSIHIIDVYIIGEVLSAGVYSLPRGSLVVDVLEAAGGATESADLNSVNLAYPLNDNMMIKIPSIDEADKNWIIDKGNLFSETPTSPSAVHTDQSSDEKVNINKATVSQLCSLPGIGESTAQKIVDYREKNGPFEDVYDITNINGIKDAKYEQIKDYITVDD